jgi:hypothetical protein
MKNIAVYQSVFLAVLTYQVGSAQELMMVTTKSYASREEFTVLKADKKIRQGDYKRFSLKDDQLTIEGKYDSNQKMGEWKYYDNGTLIQNFNFSNQELKFSIMTNTSHMSEESGVQLEKVLDTPPMYLGSKVRLTEELNKFMDYPLQARRMGVDGVVITSIWIDIDRKIKVTILKGLEGGCDDELLKGLKRIDNDWIPGTINGLPVKSEYILIFEYALIANGGASMKVK